MNLTLCIIRVIELEFGHAVAAAETVFYGKHVLACSNLSK